MVIGFELLVVVRDGVDGDVGWTSIGAGVARDQIGRFEEDVSLVADSAGQWSNPLEHVVEGVSDGIVHWGLVLVDAGEEVVTIGVEWCLAARAHWALELGGDDWESELALEQELEEVVG